MTIQKFRVYDKVKKCMSEVEAIVYTENKVYPFYSKTVRRYIPFEESELMQSTGLFDMYDKEIFDGDIVKVLNSLYTVFYDSEKGSFRLRPHDKRWHTDYMSNFSHGENFEVIGNIWENKELLVCGAK